MGACKYRVEPDTTTRKWWRHCDRATQHHEGRRHSQVRPCIRMSFCPGYDPSMSTDAASCLLMMHMTAAVLFVPRREILRMICLATDECAGHVIVICFLKCGSVHEGEVQEVRQMQQCLQPHSNKQRMGSSLKIKCKLPCQSRPPPPKVCQTTPAAPYRCA